MKLLHDSRDPMYRTPPGAGVCGACVSLRLLAPEASRVRLRLWWNDAPILMDMAPQGEGMFASDVTLPERPGLLWYYFIADFPDGSAAYYGNAGDRLGGEGQIWPGEPPSFQITVYDPAFDTPHWLRDGVMLQIIVDRYRRLSLPDPAKYPKGAVLHGAWDEPPRLSMSTQAEDNNANDFFGGSFLGILEKLPYIASLGVTVIYLNPVFLATSNHKYDTADYLTIDPGYGTEAEFSKLCAKAMEMGIRVILDGVFSHTGCDSVYFNRFGNFPSVGAYQSKDSPYFPWYHFDRWPDAYDAWWGFYTLPNLDKENPDYRAFVTGENGVVAKWLEAGASGWRLDVADELPMDFIRLLRFREKLVKPDAALIGEVWEDPSNKVAYGKLRSYCLGDSVDCVMNYPLREAIFDFLLGRIDATGFCRRFDAMAENQPAPFLYSQMNLLGSHDKARAVNVLADCGNMEPERRYRYPRTLTPEQCALGKARYLLAWQIVCALPGMPCLYYGDEAGMTGMADPFCRGTYPWGSEDRDMLARVREAASLRRAHAVLRTGRVALSAAGKDVAIIQRYGNAFGEGGDSAALAVNRSDGERKITFDGRERALPPMGAAWLAYPTCET